MLAKRTMTEADKHVDSLTNTHRVTMRQSTKYLSLSPVAPVHSSRSQVRQVRTCSGVLAKDCVGVWSSKGKSTHLETFGATLVDDYRDIH